MGQTSQTLGLVGGAAQGANGQAGHAGGGEHRHFQVSAAALSDVVFEEVSRSAAPSRATSQSTKYGDPVPVHVE